MRTTDRVQVFLLVALLLSLGVNIFLVSHELGRQSVLRAQQTQAEPPGARDRAQGMAFRQLAQSLSPEGRATVGEGFRAAMPELRAASQRIAEQRQRVAQIIQAQDFSEAQFKAAFAELEQAQQARAGIMRGLFAEAMVSLSAEDRKLLAQNFGQATRRHAPPMNPGDL